MVTRILDADRRVVMKMSQTREIPAGADVTFPETKVLSDDVRLWWPNSPYMYTAHTTVLSGETAIDAVETPFGIRKFELAAGKGFLVNGQAYELTGVNWHQMYPYVGNAVPDSMRAKDALRLKKAGIRIVRMAHYPHDNSFVEACDRLGILLYAEPPTWIEFGTDAFQDNLEQALRRMIRNYRNHPSILFYGAGVNHLGPVERLQSAAKEEDPTRITASNGTDWTGPHDAGAADLYTPMIFSGWDTSESFLFGIEAGGSRDAESNQRLVSTFMGMPSHIGETVWTGNDYNTFHSGKPMSRGGMVDYSGIPRDHYYWYKSELTAEPMVYIANLWTGQDGGAAAGGRGGAQPETGKVRIFSNCEEVELFLNGKSLGKRSPDRTPAKVNLEHPSILFDVDFQPGELKAVGLMGGAARATSVVRTPEQPDHLRVDVDTADRSFVADGADMVWAYAHIEDHNGTTVATSRDKVTFTVSGPGQIVGGAEIGSNPVVADGGIARVLVRAGLTPGAITLTASAEGLKPASASFATTAFSENIPIQPYFEPLRIKVDLGSSGLTTGTNGFNLYHVQPGWTAWVGSGEADETKSFAELGGATLVLKKASGASGVKWVNNPDLYGVLNFMAEDGVMASAADGLSLTFKGLKPGRYQMTTYHHLPTAPDRRGGGSSINIFVDDAAAKNRAVATGVRPTGGSPVRKPGPTSAVFIFSVDASGTATVRMVAGSGPGDIWLNGFRVEGLRN